jgi:predicted nucleotidyltransferase
MKQFGLKTEDIQKINTIFEQYGEIYTVILYGSRAKGNFKNGSDIDLTIIENNLDFKQLIAIENKIDDLLLPYKIDLSQKKHITNNELLEHIERIGKIFYNRLTIS